MALFYEAVLNFTSPAGAIKNVLHYDVSDPSPEALAEATDLIGASWVTQCRNLFVTSVAFASITWRPDSTGTVGVDYTPALAPIAGTSPETNFMGQAALVIKKVSNGSLRPKQGRLFIGGLGLEYLNINGEWVQANRDKVRDWVEFCRSFSTTVNPCSFQMLIKATNPTAPFTQQYSPVDEVLSVANPATQRRRRKGVGV